MLPLLTILCPVYNEEKTVPLFWGRLEPVIRRHLERYRIDLVFLDNASTDRTHEEIARIKAVYPSTYIVCNSRNVGYQRSLMLGLQHTVGDLFLFIDVDCEDPPEMIAYFLLEHENGFDIVYGERMDREEFYPIKMIRKWFYRLLQAFADDDVILDMAEFSLFTSEVRDAITQENTSYPFIRTSISRVGFRRKGIPFKRQKRIAGKTHYNFLGMAVFAVAGLLAASTLPLRVAAYIMPLAIAAMIGAGMMYVQTQEPVYAVTAATIFATYVSMTLAFVSLYVARTYKNGLHRPVAFLDKKRSTLQPSVAGLVGARASSPRDAA